MDVVAVAKHIRISPQKVRILVEEIKKVKPQDAVEVLGHINRSAAIPLKKTIASALANARHNHSINADLLTFKSIQIGQGRMLKRYRPVSRGRAHAILKRTSHIRVVLEEEGKINTSNKSHMSDTSNKKKGNANGSKS